jgi:hypothetical protein
VLCFEDRGRVSAEAVVFVFPIVAKIGFSDFSGGCCWLVVLVGVDRVGVRCSFDEMEGCADAKSG